MLKFQLLFLFVMFNMSTVYAQAKNTTQPNTVTVSSGTLLLKTDVKKGQVFVNQQLITSLPFPGPWTLMPGSYELELKNDKGNLKKQSFKITANQQTELKIEMGNKQAVRESIEEPKETEKEVHIGAGFSLVKASYIIGSVGILALGYGAYAQLSAQDTMDQANTLDKANHSRSDQNQLVFDAEGSAFTSKLALASGSIAVVSAIAMMLWSKDGFLSPSTSTQSGAFSTQVFSTGNGLGLGSTF